MEAKQGIASQRPVLASFSGTSLIGLWRNAWATTTAKNMRRMPPLSGMLTLLTNDSAGWRVRGMAIIPSPIGTRFRHVLTNRIELEENDGR